MSLCRHLTRQGVEVAVACLRERVKGSRSLRGDLEQLGVRVVPLGADHRCDWRFPGRVMQVLDEERPDILHTHLPRADVAGLVARWRHPTIRWVCTVHDIHSRSWSGRWALAAFNVVWRYPDAVIAVSHAVKAWLVTSRRIPEHHVHVIHYGIDGDQFPQSASEIRRRRGLNGRATLGSLGRLEPRKGFQTLIQAMGGVLQRMDHAELFIAGHDPWAYSKTLHARIEQAGLSGQVHLVPFQDDVPSFLHGLDLFVFASRSEGFGRVVIEAMAAGKPVVASRIAPLTEIVIEGETGLLVDPESPEAFAEAIAWVLQHPDDGRRMGQAGRERVRREFTAVRMTEQTLSLYHALLAQRP